MNDSEAARLVALLATVRTHHLFKDLDPVSEIASALFYWENLSEEARKAVRARGLRDVEAMKKMAGVKRE